MSKLSDFHRLAAVAVLLIALPVECLAYVDPAAGSLLLQGIIGGIAACVGLGGAYWRKILRYFSRNESETQSRIHD